MNLVRLHYADGSVESFDTSYPVNAHNVRRREVLGLRWAGAGALAGFYFSGKPVATTNAYGRPGNGVAGPLADEPRWNPDRLLELRFFANVAKFEAANREELVGYRPRSLIVDEVVDLDPPSLEPKPRLAWWILGAALVLAIAAAMIGQSVGGAS